MNKIYFLLLVLIISSLPLSAQDTYLQLFDNLLAVEDQLDGEITEELLSQLNILREQIENSPYSDLQTRLKIIDHIINVKMPSTDLKESLKSEVNNLSTQKKQKTFNTLSIVSGGVSLLAGATLTTSLMLAESMHEQFLKADTASDAADFLYKRDMLDIVSLISGGVFLAGVITTSTLIALRPSSQEIQGRSYIDFEPDVTNIEPGNSLFARLVLKRAGIVNEIKAVNERRLKLDKLMGFTKYTAIGGAAAMGAAFVLSAHAYNVYNHTDNYDTVQSMKKLSQNSIVIGSLCGVISVICLTANIYINHSTSDKRLKKALRDVDTEIINYPFYQSSE
jgi:hypothetical protein